MGKGRLGSETVWWEEEEGLDMRMRRTGGRITYGIRSRRIKTCCKLLLLHIATQNQVTKSAQRIKLVSVPDPTDTRQIYYLRHSATSNGGSLVCTFVGLISLKENFTPAQRSIICVLHLTYKQPFHSASSFPSLRAFISPSLLPSLHPSLPQGDKRLPQLAGDIPSSPSPQGTCHPSSILSLTSKAAMAQQETF